MSRMNGKKTHTHTPSHPCTVAYSPFVLALRCDLHPLVALLSLLVFFIFSQVQGVLPNALFLYFFLSFSCFAQVQGVRPNVLQSSPTPVLPKTPCGTHIPKPGFGGKGYPLEPFDLSRRYYGGEHPRELQVARTRTTYTHTYTRAPEKCPDSLID